MKLYASTISRLPLIRRGFCSPICINTQPTEPTNMLLYQRYYSKTIHSTSFRFSLNMTVQYAATFWPVVDSAELADGPTGCGEMARGRRLFACNFSVTKSSVWTEAQRTLNQTWRCRCASDLLLAWLTDWRTYVLTYLCT